MFDSTDLHPLLADAERLDAGDLERHVGNMIRQYARHRSDRSAHLIVHYIEALYRHPDLDGDDARRCAYRRLARHWGWLARHQRTEDLMPAAEAPMPAPAS